MKTLSTARELTFPEIAVGDAFTVEHTFTETDVRVFAELSGDYSPLHVDPTYASTTEAAHVAAAKSSTVAAASPTMAASATTPARLRVGYKQAAGQRGDH